MQKFEIKSKSEEIILALGAESAGNFSVHASGVLHFSQDFGDLMIDTNFQEYKKRLIEFLRKSKIKPNIILSDLHPNFHTTLLAQELAKKYKAKYIPVQHHLAHIFSAIGDKIINDPKTYNLKPKTCLGIACDGTGFGFDEKIWGGEVFRIAKRGTWNVECEMQIRRVGHLENQILIGGEKAIQEPARLLISILAKIYPPSPVIPGSTRNPGSRNSKNNVIYEYVKKFYTRNEFNLLLAQLGQNFNCLETSSTARILDAVSVLLGFSKNERLSKHGPVELLEKNSTKPFINLQPKIERYKIQDTKYKQISHFNTQNLNEMPVLNTTFLFEYLIKNLHKDKHRLAATAQKYIADGLLEIIKNLEPKTYNLEPIYFAGGMANNKIISSILESQGSYTNKKIPRGDAGISFGQIFYNILLK